MEVHTNRTGRTLMISLVGELDHHAARETMQKVSRALEAELPPKLTLDLSRVTFMDSSGIAVVLRSQRRMEDVGGTLTLKSVPAQAQKVFDAAGITPRIQTED